MAVSQTLTLTEVPGSVDTSANTSKVRILWQSTQTGNSWNGYTRTAKYYISINGEAETEHTVSYTLPKASTATILDITITVAHKDNGSGTITVRTWMDTSISAGVVEKTRILALTTIPKVVNTYKPPYIAPASGHRSVICERCTEDGDQSDTGTFLHVKGTRNYTKTNNGAVNTCSVRCRYKPEGGSWSHGSGAGVAVLLASNTSTDEFDVILPNIVSDITLSYTVELNIVDDTNIPIIMVFNIPSEAVDFELREGGKGAAFGKHAIVENLLDCTWDAKFHKNLSIQGELVADFIIEQGVSGIWEYRKWYSGKAECWGRSRVELSIDTSWGSLYYGVSTGVPFPSGLFIADPMCQVTAEFGAVRQVAWRGAGGEATKANAPDVYFFRPAAGDVSFDILYHAFGNWK